VGEEALLDQNLPEVLLDAARGPLGLEPQGGFDFYPRGESLGDQPSAEGG